MDMLLRRQIKKATNVSKANYLSDMHKLKKSLERRWGTEESKQEMTVK